MAPRKPSAKTPPKPLPEVTESNPSVELVETPQKELPEVGNPENMITIGKKKIEIKPTKVRYQRDRTQAFYKALELYPLAQILATDVGGFDSDRNGDKCVMDWLIAVTDDPKLVVDNYNDMDTDTIEKLLEIFRRVNKIDEKEENLKNLEAAGRGARKA